MNNEENQFNRIIYEDAFKNTDLVLAETIEDGINLINETVKAVVITSGSLGRALLPKICNFGNLMGILVFCYRVNDH